MQTISKDSEKCKACKHYNNCNNKRKIMCAMAEISPPILAPAAESATAPLMRDMAVKHDYRTIHAGYGMDFDIDLEEVKKQIAQDFYKALNCPFLEYGA